MNINLTDITKNIGNTIVKIKNNNELITELNKAYNPTFTEILEDVKDSDPTLATLLMFWYQKKYSESDLDRLTTNIRKQFGLKDKVKKKTKQNKKVEKPSKALSSDIVNIESNSTETISDIDEKVNQILK